MNPQPANGAAAAEVVARWQFGMAPNAPAALLDRGGVLAIPTESSYGLAIDPRNPDGVAAVFRIKARPASSALPVVAADTEQLLTLGVDPADPGLAAAKTLWPMPLTVIVRLAPGRRLPAAADTEDGGQTLAVRLPAHSRLRELLAAVGPLTATSANRSGEPPILDPDDLETLLAGEDAMIIDAGTLDGGPPSTLARFQNGALQFLRRGAVLADELACVARSIPGTPSTENKSP